ncbi:SGNH hydrolase [Amycolatopsis antarctica]|uniref:SGNH hydrolase n=1 Tax=Amycolatopsis antarctica TaxID=1854586 RepID=A0A263D753_9PSEU|nr:SGNH/GDSL hydrolase family protein [Amycolatopsis antarctica]OZM73316.1 SGNH hydrolase [Amycolatopsis antarctica]
MIRRTAWTLATLAGSPLLLAQAVRVRRATPKLPGAQGPVDGEVRGTGAPLRLLVIGESTVDGVGARTHDEALTGRIAQSLATRLGRGVRWRALGLSGANARTVRRRLLRDACALPADLVVIALGVNDVIELHSAARYRRDLLRLLLDLRRGLGPVPVLFAGVPPLDRFPNLPWPLRAVLGARSRALGSAATTLDALPGVSYVPVPADILRPEWFADDGFHPGPEAYLAWGRQLAEVAPG